jgi:hypothetical protein
MTAQPPLKRSWWLRRLFTRDGLVVALIFVVCAFTLPRLLSLLTIAHFETKEQANIYVAVQHAGDGFDLVGVKAPVTLPATVFVADGSKPSGPSGTETTDRVHVLKRDGASTLIETVWSNDDYVITSRYRVAGQQISPVSRQTFGTPQAAQGLMIAAILALVLKFMLARRRSSRALSATQHANN